MLKLEDLVCPHCNAMNRPGVSVIVREPNGLILCTVCTHGWRDGPEPPPEPPR